MANAAPTISTAEAGEDRLLGATGNDELNGGAGRSRPALRRPRRRLALGGRRRLRRSHRRPRQRLDRRRARRPRHRLLRGHGRSGHDQPGSRHRERRRERDADRDRGRDRRLGRRHADRLDRFPQPPRRRPWERSPRRRRAGRRSLRRAGQRHLQPGFTTETSCGPCRAERGTAVELYQSIDESTSLIVTGNSGDRRRHRQLRQRHLHRAGRARRQPGPARRSRLGRLLPRRGRRLGLLPGPDLLDPCLAWRRR